MTEQELRERIISEVKYIKFSGMSPEWHTDQILAFVKEAGYKSPEEVAFFTDDVAKAEGYVKLAENQSLPIPSLGIPHSAYECFQVLVKAGWRKVLTSGALSIDGINPIEPKLVKE